MTGRIAAPHQAEAWRSGHEPRVEFGWHCLTCGEEGTAFSATVAENRAAAHIRDTASGQVQSPDDGIRDTLIDCMTSFGCHGDTAAEAADYILSERSGLVVTVAP